MSAPCSMFDQCSCASCQAAAAITPLTTSNRPGLPAISYRVGTFSTFRQAMLDYITLHPVANPDPGDASTTFTLTTRSSDDYGIAMLELWAYVCDVLTFYQQSIANEAYLRTATQQGSIARLAALLGYRPSPAIAASVYLAFLASQNATAIVPAGLQTQSDPPPGQNSVLFEVVAPLSATAANNQPVLLGQTIPLALNKSGVLIVDDPNTPLTEGTSVLFFNSSSVSEQQVDSVTQGPVGKLVTLRGNLGGVPPNSVTAYRLGRTFRCFGTNAPAFYSAFTTSGSTSSFTPQKTSFALPAAVNSSSPLSLDSVYTGLGAGAPIVIEYEAASKTIVMDTIGAVRSGGASVGPLTGSVTQITLTSTSIPINTDLRTITVYELLGSPLLFATTSFDSSSTAGYPAGTQSINVVDASSIQKDGELILSSQDPILGVFGDVLSVSFAPAPISQNGVTLGYAVQFSPGLSQAYVLTNTSLFANVTAATQGKTQSTEVLGNGDASQEFQQFSLKSNPVTYVPNSAAEFGAASTLRVFVNSLQWTEVDSFYGRGPADQIFVTSTGDDGTVSVQFGDGVTGQRPPTGTGNIMATYRVGAGSSGNVAAGSITQMLQTISGLQSVVNPLPATGGADGEALDQTRVNAPVSVLTLGRAVSLLDYEALALTFHGIAKARASWSDFAGRRGVALTVAAAGNQSLAPLAQPLRDFLDDHRDPNVPLTITGATSVNFVFRARLHLLDGHLQSVVLAAAQAALGPSGQSGLLSYAELQIGQSIFQSQLIAVLQDVAGVNWVELFEFSTAAYADGVGFLETYKAVAKHIAFFPRPIIRLDVVYISPQQIAWPSLSGAAGDFSVDLTCTGGVNDLQ